jgi:hypothetical protein
MQASTPISSGQAIAPSGEGSPTRWAVAGFLIYLVAWPVTLMAALLAVDLAAGIVGADTSAGTIGLSIRNAVHPVVWGLVVAGIALPIGRRFVPGVAGSRTGWAILVVGLVIAAVADFLSMEFVRERFGYYDPEMAGWAGLAPAGLVAVALAAWATLSLPADRAASLAALTAATGLILVLILQPSLPGLSDGIDPSSLPLVIALGLGVTYAALAFIVAARYALRARLGG